MDLTRLNPPQRQAVTHASGPLLVLAGAGSGKTRVITFRIAHLIGQGVNPEHICALTFTNKAAEEMRHRVAELLGSRREANKLSMGTFHSLGLRILKQERKAMGLPRGFAIYDGADQLGVIREVMRRIGTGDRRFDAKAILSRISLAKNSFIAPEDYQANDSDEYDHITADVYPKYQRALRAYGALDFDDLIVESVRIVREDEDVQRRWRNMYRHVLVDEYQDTNKAQLSMVRELVCNHYNLCVVGDDDQSIYSWRGADPSGILSFEKQFDNATVVKLEQNYRSAPNILAAANAVIGNNKDRYGKTLYCDLPEGPAIVEAVAPDAATEAQFVVREIQRLVSDENESYKDCAVLYRSNKQAKLIEEELRQMQIPYTMIGGQQFFERKEVKDVIAYLRLALNARDEIALRRIVNFPARGIGPGTIEHLIRFAAQHSTPLWNALVRASEVAELRSGQKRAIAGFVELAQKLSRNLDGESVAAATRSLIEDIDLYGDMRAGSPSMNAAQKRIDNVESLIRSLTTHEKRNPGRRALMEFLRKLSLESDTDEQVERGNRVLLTTLHGSKGLEFPSVFLIGLEEELLPHARTLQPQATDMLDADHASDISEERRLAYVGITRAQRRLYMSRTAARILRGKQVPRTPSRFLLEVPQELVEQLDIASEAMAPVETEELSAFFQSFLSSVD